MREIFLNTWQAKAGKDFFDFVKNESLITDIFCFMEVSPELHSQLSKELKDHDGYYTLGGYFSDGMRYGQSGFFKKELKAGLEKELTIINEWTGRAVLYKARVAGKEFRVFNIHGVARPGHKLDTNERLEQSKIIINSLKDSKTPVIIGGDFNLMPDTSSLKMFEDAGYLNLIKEFNIKSTRNRFSWEQFKGEPGFTVQHYADYVFVSPDVKVKNFEVPYMEISDHLPLILDFEI